MDENKKETFLQRLRRKREEKETTITKKVEVVKPREPGKKPEGLKDQIAEMSEQIDRLTGEDRLKKKLKKKQFKLPAKVRSQLKKLAIKNKVQVILLQNNRNIKPTIGEIKNGMLNIGGKIYNGASDFVWLWNGKFPTVLVAEWDINPISGSRLLDVAAQNKSWSDPQAIIIRAIEFKESLNVGSKMSGKMMVWVGIGALVVLYVLFAGS
ncbi:hypothetical protein LCGC14_2393200 [marine sediment metagenome]|uniref:Uncharacterized protein n=1 Tax=marine sediment metagenome TaxID=412755 RepID=A0A0F9BXJ6_9ZZZZ